MKTTLSPRCRKARSFYFAQLVADYFHAFAKYPAWHELRVLFLYATRKAGSY